MSEVDSGPWGVVNDPWQGVIDEGLEEKVPKRGRGEDRDKFLSRCMGDPEMRSSWPRQDQRFAICRRQADRKTYGEEEGEEKEGEAAGSADSGS
jgi:hypothetical protein